MFVIYEMKMVSAAEGAKTAVKQMRISIFLVPEICVLHSRKKKKHESLMMMGGQSTVSHYNMVKHRQRSKNYRTGTKNMI